MFFRRNKKKESERVVETKVNEDELRKNIESFLNQLDSAHKGNRIEILNELGQMYFELNDIDNSIKYYETSIHENRSLGKAYTDLMKLYNMKRKQAVEDKDEKVVQLYLNKIDDLMKLSKDVIRGL